MSNKVLHITLFWAAALLTLSCKEKSAPIAPVRSFVCPDASARLEWAEDYPFRDLAAIGRYGVWADYMATGDKTLIEAAYPEAKAYIEGLAIDADGLVQGPGDALQRNFWYVLGLQGLSDMADIVGAEGEGGVLWSRMLNFRKNLAQKTWTGSAYQLSETGPDPLSNALAVLSGAAAAEQYEALFQVLQSAGTLSPAAERCVCEALFAIGRGDYAWERYGGSEAFRPLGLFGLSPMEPGWTSFSVRPDPSVSEACGLSVSTVQGRVALAFDPEKRLIELAVPEGCRAELTFPESYVHKVLGPGKHRVDLGAIQPPAPGAYPYQNASLPVDKRVKDLLKRMSTEEKVAQISAQLLFMEQFYDRRDYALGHIRNVGHFMGGASPRAVAEAINEDTRRSILANRWGIPALQHGEALHGAQWGDATCFPQSIALGATFDDGLYYRVGQVVAEELRAVGVRQVYAPVVNITRDQRWGRGQESYGEDVLLNSRMGVAYVKALEEGGVVATPKHFVDNYGEGGHDSFASVTSWRELREVYLEPFRACIEEGGARGVMSAYNSVDGEPASCNPRLLKDILKEEWGFGGIVVSDYDAVNIVHRHHGIAASEEDALALCLNAGLDIELHTTGSGLLGKVLEGSIPERVLDEAVRRVLKIKFELGLFDAPFVPADKADSLVRSPEHRELAYEAACKSMTLLKNDGILPLKGVRRIGLYGPAAHALSLGDYSGNYQGWSGEGALTPYEGLRRALEGRAEVLLNPEARSCDVLLFFPSITEEEGKDRSSFGLPSAHIPQGKEAYTGGLIVAKGSSLQVEVDQEALLRALIASGKPVVVVLQNGAVIDISGWVDGTAAVLEAWYGGEQGGRAIADVLTGAVNPGGRLPFSWVRHIGQNPYYYSIKPSGRGYGYVENDGKPLYPFGYGLSYTRFAYSDFRIPDKIEKGESLKVSVTVTNTGEVAGDEVVQVYLHDELATVVRPLRQLAAFKRVTLSPGESREVSMEIPCRQFGLWDRNLNFTVEEGWFEVWIGRNADEAVIGGKVYVK